MGVTCQPSVSTKLPDTSQIHSVNELASIVFLSIMNFIIQKGMN